MTAQTGNLAEFYMVYWITGRKGCGKTTLAHKIAAQIPNSVVLDGDHVRSYFPSGYTDEARYENQARITNIARILEDQGVTVIIACVSPRKSVRKELQSKFTQCIEIQLPGGELWPGTYYED